MLTSYFRVFIHPENSFKHIGDDDHGISFIYIT